MRRYFSTSDYCYARAVLSPVMGGETRPSSVSSMLRERKEVGGGREERLSGGGGCRLEACIKIKKNNGSRAVTSVAM